MSSREDHADFGCFLILTVIILSIFGAFALGMYIGGHS